MVEPEPASVASTPKLDTFGTSPSVQVGPSGFAPNLAVASDEDFNKWLEHFYKECGREVTLAYTTLNQMKNWGIIIVAAVLSAVVSLSRPGATGPALSLSAALSIYAGSLIVLVFTVRFFVRAILCYINLSRWNNLQSAIVSLKLVQPTPRSGAIAKSAEQLKAELLTKIQDLYFSWRAPSRLTRKDQLVSNLKLGFALLLALPIFFAVVSGSRVLADSAMARGLTTFAIGYMLIETLDFWRGTWFDTPEAYAKRKSGRDREIFPTPVSDGEYILYWLLIVLVSVIVGLWPQVVAMLRQLICGKGVG
jgi:hypothetical protein